MDDTVKHKKKVRLNQAKKDTKHGKTNYKEVPSSRHIPYSHLVSPTTLATTDGLLIKIIKLEGFSHGTEDQLTLNHIQEKRNNLLIGISSSKYAIWSTIIRRKQQTYPGGVFDDGFASELNEQYKSKILKKNMFVNDLYISIVRKPSNNKVLKFSDFLQSLSTVGDVATRKSDRADTLRELEEISDRVIANLSPYHPKPLGVKKTDIGLESEILRFLSFLINGIDRKVLIPKKAINSYIANVRPFFAKDAFELKGLRDSKIGGCLTIKEYAGITKPSIFDQLLTLDFEFILTQSFIFTDRNTTLTNMKIQKRQLEGAGDDAVSLIDELAEGMDDVASGRICCGKHHLTLVCFADNKKQLQKNLAISDSTLGDQGIISVREDTALEASFWAQLPGNSSYIGRSATITSQNYASFCSYHNYPSGKLKDNHWGDAISLLETVSGTPYYFNLHVHDLGNTTIIGPSGSGKTVLMTFLQAQLEKFKPKRVYFDKDRGAEIFIRAIDGYYATIVPGKNTGFNPFQIPETPQNKDFLISLLAFMLSEQGKPLGAIDMEHVTRLVTGCFDLELKDRNLEVLSSYLPQGTDNHLAIKLKQWYGAGNLAWLYGSKTDSFPENNRTIGFDLTHILEEPVARAACLRYMFFRVEQMIDGNPITITLDEGWKGLEDDFVSAKVFDWEKTIRKRNGCFIFGSQSPRDLSETRIGTTIIEQSPTQIFYPNTKADYDSYCKAFSLTNKEFDLIKNKLDPSDRSFLIKHGINSVIAKLDLKGMDDALAILSGREETVRLLDDIRKTVGDDPKDWIPLFHKKRKIK